MSGRSLTVTDKAYFLINVIHEYTKAAFAEELGISRPTLDVRLEKENWKTLETKWIHKLYEEKYIKLHS